MREFDGHMIKRRSIGQNYLGWQDQGIDPKIPDHPFHDHFVSGSGGVGVRVLVLVTNYPLKHTY